MGWSSGTSIFDKVVDSTINFIPVEDRTKAYLPIFKELRDGDWDTVDESDYFHEPWMLDILIDDGYFDEWYTLEDYVRDRDE